MKRILVFILSLIYFTSVTGATIHLHYCMGSLAEWNFGQRSSDTCGKCGMEKGDELENGCCKDEFRFVKNVSDQKAAESSLEWLQLYNGIPPVSPFQPVLQNPAVVTSVTSLSHAPPRWNGAAVYIRNCILLI